MIYASVGINDRASAYEVKIHVRRLLGVLTNVVYSQQ